MGKYDERHSMERMMGLRGPTRKKQLKKQVNKQVKPLDDEQLGEVGAVMGEGNDLYQFTNRGRRKARRNRGSVQSILQDHLQGGSMLGGG